MRIVLKNLWNDDAGYIVSAELLFLFTIAVLGLLVGWVNIRNAVVAESTDVANAILALNQSYSYSGLTNECLNPAETAGSSATDLTAPLATFVSTPPIDPAIFVTTACP